MMVFTETILRQPYFLTESIVAVAFQATQQRYDPIVAVPATLAQQDVGRGPTVRPIEFETNSVEGLAHSGTSNWD